MTDQLTARLMSLAAERKTIRYGVLARELQVSVAQLAAMLEHMMEQDAAKGLPFRAALCEGKLSDGLPARGFFDKAQALGRDIHDPAAMVACDRAALFTSATDS